MGKKIVKTSMAKDINGNLKKILEKILHLENLSEDLSKANEEQARIILKLEERNQKTEEKLLEMEESLEIFKYGTKAIKDKHIEEYRKKGKLEEIDFQHKLILLIRQDKGLTEPHKRLMEFMINQFDDLSHKFKEVPYKDIKRGAPVSESRLSKYLKDLVEKGFLIRKGEGHHVFYKTNYKAYEKGKEVSINDLTEEEKDKEEITGMVY